MLMAIATIGSAAAQPAEGTRLVRRDVVVRYEDLNLNDKGDVAILLDRIDDAAEEACGGPPAALYEADYTYLRQEYHRCHADAVARAVDSIGMPLVKELMASSRQ
jgi:UrcA family protein